MRRSLIFLSAIVISMTAAPGRLFSQIIENPKNPPSPNAGRVVPLKEVFRISDEKGRFFFVEPLNVFVGTDGSVYVHEYKQLLKFTAAGRFVKNLLKKGQGPGEYDDHLTDVIVRDKDIVLWSSNNFKLVRIDLDGTLIADRKITQSFLHEMLGAFGGKYFFLRWEPEGNPRPKVTGIYERPLRLVIVPEKGDALPTPYFMPVTDAYEIGDRGAGILTISRPMPEAAGDREVFVFFSPSYLIGRLDLESGKVVRSFRRFYDRVKYNIAKSKGYPDELYPQYHNDLCRLLWRNGKLWAITSTFDPKKGILVDVFDREGRYLDNFYLPLFKIRRDNPQFWVPMAASGNFLYVLEADEDDLMTLVKYEIGESAR